MCSRNYTIVFGLFFLSFYQSYGQRGNTEKLSPDLALGALQTASVERTNRPVIDENSIYIQQIGSSNMASFNVYGKNKEVNLIQNGHANAAKVDLSGESVSHNILQNGNDNLFLEYGTSPNLNLDRQIIQDGNHQGVVIFGSNTLTDKLMIHQQSGLKTITIRNFN